MKFAVSARVLAAAVVMSAAGSFSAVADGHTDEFTGAKGYVGSKGYVGEAPRPVTQQQYAGNKYHGTHRKRFRAVQRLSVPGCPVGFNGMYRGNLYCINGRPID